MEEISPGIWKKDEKLLTKNLVPGFRSYTEEFLTIKKEEYRVWDPTRSKAAAGLKKGIRIPIEPGMKMLYLGAAQGYTSSFFSDITGKNGVIYAVEISERAVRDLQPVAKKRGNIVPILANARKPQEYDWIEPVDLVYQDVATSDQSEILIKNCKRFLKPNGTAVIAIKSRSIDVTREPEEIYKQELEKLTEHFKILDKKKLDPLEKDHMLIVLSPKI